MPWMPTPGRAPVIIPKRPAIPELAGRCPPRFGGFGYGTPTAAGTYDRIERAIRVGLVYEYH